MIDKQKKSRSGSFLFTGSTGYVQSAEQDLSVIQ